MRTELINNLKKKSVQIINNSKRIQWSKYRRFDYQKFLNSLKINIMKSTTILTESSKSNYIEKKRITWTEHKRLWLLANKY